MDKNFPRLLDTLRLVPVGRNATALEIHQHLLALGYKVSRRTVERDLDALAIQYNLSCNRRSKPYGWAWASRQARPVVGDMDIPHALALELMQRELGDLMPPAARDALDPWFEEAAKRMRTASHTAAAKWPKKIAIQSYGPPLLPAKVSRAVLDGVNEALFLDQQIEAEYRSKYRDEFSKVHLHPLGLILTGLVTYLVVVYEGYDDPRLLALHRLRRVRLLNGFVRRPAGFDLQKYVEAGALNFGNGKTIKLKLRMPADTAEHLGEMPLSRDQVMTADGKGFVTIAATVVDSRRLQWWLRGFGKDVKVISPSNYWRS
jgi:predicted DNA-binding transcriptional regulator YafY